MYNFDPYVLWLLLKIYPATQDWFCAPGFCSPQVVYKTNHFTYYTQLIIWEKNRELLYVMWHLFGATINDQLIKKRLNTIKAK